MQQVRRKPALNGKLDELSSERRPDSGPLTAKGIAQGWGAPIAGRIVAVRSAARPVNQQNPDQPTIARNKVDAEPVSYANSCGAHIALHPQSKGRSSGLARPSDQRLRKSLEIRSSRLFTSPSTFAVSPNAVIAAALCFSKSRR